MKFSEYLSWVSACFSSRDWVGDKGIREAWDTCHRSDWQAWLLNVMGREPRVLDVLVDAAFRALEDEAPKREHVDVVHRMTELVAYWRENKAFPSDWRNAWAASRFSTLGLSYRVMLYVEAWDAGEALLFFVTYLNPGPRSSPEWATLFRTFFAKYVPDERFKELWEMCEIEVEEKQPEPEVPPVVDEDRKPTEVEPVPPPVDENELPDEVELARVIRDAKEVFTFQTMLGHMHACNEGRRDAGDRSIKAAWQQITNWNHHTWLVEQLVKCADGGSKVRRRQLMIPMICALFDLAFKRNEDGATRVNALVIGRLAHFDEDLTQANLDAYADAMRSVNNNTMSFAALTLAMGTRDMPRLTEAMGYAFCAYRDESNDSHGSHIQIRQLIHDHIPFEAVMEGALTYWVENELVADDPEYAFYDEEDEEESECPECGYYECRFCDECGDALCQCCCGEEEEEEKKETGTVE